MKYPTENNIDEEFNIYDAATGKFVKTTWRKEINSAEFFLVGYDEDGEIRLDTFAKKPITGMKFP